MFIDLSVTLNEQTPVYPGDMATKIESANTVDKNSCNDHYVSTNNHTGTHIDAPLHIMATGSALSQMPIEQFVGRGQVVEVDPVFDLKSIKQAGIKEGDIVLFHTGMSKHYYEPVYFEKYPVMSEEIANYLVECKVKMIGIDACSVDNTDDFRIHKIVLGGNVLIIENLANLDKLAGKNFTVYALPIKLDIDGAPARVIAEVKL